LFTFSNGPTVAVPLSVTGIATTVSASATNLAFGAVDVGTASPAQTVTITNTGSYPAYISGVSGTSGPVFNQAAANTCSTSAPIAAGGTCVLSVSATPNVLGAISGVATVTFTDAATVTVSMTVTGISTVVSAGSGMSFGSVPVRTDSSDLMVLLTNNGANAADFTGVTGMTGPVFNYDSTYSDGQIGACAWNTVLAANGGQCFLAMTAAPNAAGSITSDVTFTFSNATPVTVPLSVTGVATSVGVTPSTGSISLGSVPVWTTSPTGQVTLTNNGNAPAVFTSIVGDAGPVFDSAAGNTCTATRTIAAGGSCVLQLSAEPNAGGAITGSVTVTFSDAPSVTVALSVTGIGLVTVSASSLSFGTVPFAVSSLLVANPQAVEPPWSEFGGATTPNFLTGDFPTATITNPGPTKVQFSSVAASSPTTGLFTSFDTTVGPANTCGATTVLAVGASCVVSFSVDPAAYADGPISGSYTATFTDANSVTVPFSVLQVADPTVSASPSTGFGFGTVASGATGTQSVTLSMASDLTIMSVSVGGASLFTGGPTSEGTPFTWSVKPVTQGIISVVSSSNCVPGNYYSGSETCMLALTAKPTSTAAFSSTVVVTFDDGWRVSLPLLVN
jgi:hypothetical protein